MKERPILFSGPMVRAILDGRKTQTRRIVKPQPPALPVCVAIRDDEDGCWYEQYGPKPSGQDVLRKRCPYGQCGDRMWVKEVWKYADWTEDGDPWIRYRDGSTQLKKPTEEWGDRVQDTWAELSTSASRSGTGPAEDKRWRPSIHMPRWASRLTLEVTGVRVERVQEISADDLVAEGMPDDARAPAMFMALWESINGAGSWDANPWVWVVEFKRV